MSTQNDKSARNNANSEKKADEQNSIENWEKAEKGLLHWHSLAKVTQMAHYDAARFYSGRNVKMGIAVVIITTMVGGGLLTPFEALGTWIKIPLAMISLLAAVLSALQTFLHFGELAEKHHNAAVGYGAVHIDIEYTKFTPFEDRTKLKEVLEDLKNRMESLEKESPDFPESIWEKWKSRFKEVKEDITSFYKETA